MKKYLLTIAALFGLSVISFAAQYRYEEVNAPAANQANAMMTADYGGVDYSTLCFSAGGIQLSTGSEYLVHGVNFSSSSVVGNDYVGVYDSTGDFGSSSIDWAKSQSPTLLVYASSATSTTSSTYFLANNGINGTQVWLKYPLILRKGLAWWVSSTRLNCVTLFYTKRR